MRYEKRVARNRFITFATILFLLLLGTLLVYFKKNR
jgi:predicted nucleic acid-binding Zn ribbon protein